MASNASKNKLQPQPERRERIRVLPGGWWLWCLVGVAIGLTGWLAGRQHLKTVLARQLSAAQSELDAMQSIEALLRLDGDAAQEIARGLAHPEFMVANAAYRALNEQLDAWVQLDEAERLRRMQQVMSQLEQMPQAPDHDHQILIDGLVSRIYAQALASREVGVAELLSTCKQVLQHDNRLSRVVPEQQEVWGADELPEVTRQQARDSAQSDAIPPPLQPATETESEATPVSVSERASSSDEAPVVRMRLGPRGNSSSQGEVSSRMPQMNSPSSTPPAFGMGSGRAVVQLTATPALSLEQDAAADESSPARLTLSDSEAQDVTETQSIDSGEVYSTNLTAVDTLPIEQLVRLLAHVDSRVAQAAALACKRKGMSDDKLVMAVQLAQGSSSERQQILQALVRRDDLDPRPWLLWMAEEGDVRTRIQAIGLLHPLIDGDVRRQMRLLLNRERDEEIAQAIRRLLAQ